MIEPESSTAKKVHNKVVARESRAAQGLVTRVLHIRLKDKHAAQLSSQARDVNTVWNYCNDMSQQILRREQRFVSSYELDALTAGATKEGLDLHSQTIQAVTAEYATRRKQFKKAKLNWRVSNRKSPKYSLGWIPFKASALSYRNGQLHFRGKALSLWDSYGLSQYGKDELGAGSICEDARGRWYINITGQQRSWPTEDRRAHLDRVSAQALGIDLGLKDLMTDSEGGKVEAQQFYRDCESKLAVAQRAGHKNRARAIHAKISNRRKDGLHKLSTAQVKAHQAIFVGNVNAGALSQTRLAKSVLDAGWSAYRAMLQYKCHSAGVWFKEVNESYST